jgi:hypothetical protein
MKIWAVFVYCTISGYVSRWIDSQWAQEEKACERAVELDRVIEAFRVPSHSTSVIEMSVVDAAIKEEGASLLIRESATPKPRPIKPKNRRQGGNDKRKTKNPHELP